ncbi:MAG: hypothetical protein LBC37_07195 [Zoogloeaceae bacterium]|jgi:hypothetical protein|nr:hypothetical protein [Zoogloeaceae bacterium]
MSQERNSNVGGGQKRGFLPFLFVALLMLAGCSSLGMLIAGKAVNREYIARLATDPELAIIRGKPGVSFEGCPQNATDDHYPTEEERVAIGKFGKLMAEYYDTFMRENLFHASTESEYAFLQRNKVQMDAHLQAVLALYAGKFTWAEYGQLCAQIDSERMQAEVSVPVEQKSSICEGRAQCDTYWQRAVLYITTNSKYRIRTVNDLVIETHTYSSSRKGERGLGSQLTYRAYREPLQDGKTRIWLEVGCSDHFDATDESCTPNARRETARFKAYVESGVHPRN